MLPKNIDKLISEFLSMEAASAKDSNSIGYMARSFVQATLPHSKQEGNEFERRNGFFRLTVLSPSQVGLPYGSIPRLLIAWLTTEAVRTREREIILGDTLTEFMAKLGLVPTGGRWGSITRLRDQAQRLFSSSISCTYDDGKNWVIQNVKPVSSANLWWDPKVPKQVGLSQSTIILGEEFFKESITSPVPIDLRVLKALKQSPMAVDVYCWLTYRMSYLKNSTYIPWPVLQVQFGSGYSTSSQGLRDFKRAFLRELRKINVFYSSLKIENGKNNLILHPGKSHISKLLCE